MTSHPSIRTVGLAAAAWLVGTAILFGCSRGEREKPAKTEEPPVAATETEAPTPSPAAPTPTPGAPAPGETEGAEPTPAAEPAAAAPAAGEGEAASPEPRTQEPQARGLSLVGLVRGGASPAALIEYGGSQEMFREGDEVFGRGVIERVSGDSVTIRAEGERFTLRLPAATSAPEPEAADTPPAAAAGDGPPPLREAIRRAEAERAFGSFAKLLAEAQAEAAEVGGGRGVRLAKVEPGSFLAELGLKSGDVLQKVGGVRLTDPRAVPDLSGAGAGETVTVTFVREGIGLTLSRPIR